MSEHFSVYCISKVTEPPVSLTRRQSGAFYCHIAVPIPDQLVVFCEGDWTKGDEYHVTLTYKDDEIQLGHVNKSNSCLMWKQDSKTLIPQSMSSEKENGLAKLVLEKNEGPPLLENMVESVGEVLKKTETDGKLEDKTNTPERSGKKKRRSSLNKTDKTASGPSTKKQKTETSKTVPVKQGTRVRTPKAEQKGSKSTTKNSPASENVKSDSKGCQTPTFDSSERNKKKDVTLECLGSKLKNDSKTVSNEKELKEKKGRKDSKTEETETKKVRKNIRKDEEIKSPSVKPDKNLKNNSENKPKRGKREKPKAENKENDDMPTSTIMNGVEEKSDKENVHIDSNIVTKDNTGVTVLKDSLIQHMKNNLVTSNSNVKIATCKDLTTRADKPDPRWGHSFCFVNKNLSVLIGGQGEKQQLCKDGIWSLDNETRRWKLLSVQTESQKPEYRMGHTATYDPLVRCIYVFGGSKNTRWFHDVHMLDLDEWKWQLVKVNGKAPTRAYHSATLYRHELWIFGGVFSRPDPQPDGCSNDIHIFSPVMESWYTPIVKGEKPIPRSGHSATLIDDQLVVFGGWDAPISYSDLHVLDMSIVEWTQPDITGTPPSPRSWHASCALSGKRLLIHGGYNGDFALEDTHIFNLDTLTWSQIVVENQPSARVGHKAVCMPYRHDNEEEDEMIIFGGGDNDGAYFNDLHSFYIPFHAATVV